jgi:hypothetical protein
MYFWPFFSRLAVLLAGPRCFTTAMPRTSHHSEPPSQHCGRRGMEKVRKAVLMACSANRSQRHPRLGTAGQCLGRKGRGSDIQPKVP